jgi:hypothetical protein
MDFDNPDYRDKPAEFEVTSLTLNDNQRLVGVRSASFGKGLANHVSF